MNAAGAVPSTLTVPPISPTRVTCSFEHDHDESCERVARGKVEAQESWKMETTRGLVIVGRRIWCARQAGLNFGRLSKLRLGECGRGALWQTLEASFAEGPMSCFPCCRWS